MKTSFESIPRINEQSHKHYISWLAASICTKVRGNQSMLLGSSNIVL